MDGGRFSISPDVLYQRIGAAAPIVIDSRRAPAFDADGWIIVGGICGPPDEMGAWQRDRTDNLPVVVSLGLRHQRWRLCRRVYAGAPLVKWRMALRTSQPRVSRRTDVRGLLTASAYG
jgi:hypothetical protein